MTTGALPTTIVVSLSHDGTNWTDVTSYVATAGIRFQRGRNRVLGEWVPGTWSLYASNITRAIDPTNDAATFQVRPGDEFKVAINGTTAFRGKVDTASVGYEKAGTYPLSSLTMAGSDGLATIARATVSDLGSSPAGYGTFYTGALVDLVLALSELNYYNAATTDAGDVATCLPDTGTLNALQVLQTCTRTEGGNSQLFTLKDGTLRWRSRYSRPSQVVTFGSSGVPYRDIQVDYTDDELANLVNITFAQHLDFQLSTSSVTTGTGSKSFTLTAVPNGVADGFGFSVGDVVTITDPTPTVQTMTGTVTSFDESSRVLVCDITSKSGTSTRTNWELEFTAASATVSASDAQSRATFNRYWTQDLATYHRSSTAATAEATLLAAERAYPSRRVSTVSVELKACTAGQITTVLGLEIGDAIDVSLALGTGTPSTLRQVRQIDGIAHTISGTGSHLVTFTLGPEVSVNWTATLKQNGSTVTSTTTSAIYTVNDQLCTARLLLTATAAGTVGTEVKVTPSGLPTPAVTGNKAMGEFTYNDGGTYYIGAATFDGTDITLRVHNSSSQLGATPSFAVANTDTLSLVITYPIA